MTRKKNKFVLNNDWKIAHAWVDIANNEKEGFSEPKWKFDCNFKLDFDGAFMSVNSRFYYDRKKDLWEGDVSLLLLKRQVKEMTITGKNLDEIKEKAEKLIEDWKKSFNNFEF